jgi:hypothetical protein
MGISNMLKGRALRYAIAISAGSCYLLFGYDQVGAQDNLLIKNGKDSRADLKQHRVCLEDW